jgi:hypothetical protein
MSDEAATVVGFAWSVIGATFVSIGVWLVVRIVNRKERWAKWTAVALATTPALYVLSSGPMTVIAMHRKITTTSTVFPDGTEGFASEIAVDFGKWFPAVYAPLFWSAEQPWGEFVFEYWEFCSLREAETKP